LDCSPVSNKNFSEILSLNGWHPGPDAKVLICFQVGSMNIFSLEPSIFSPNTHASHVLVSATYNLPVMQQDRTGAGK